MRLSLICPHTQVYAHYTCVCGCEGSDIERSPGVVDCWQCGRQPLVTARIAHQTVIEQVISPGEPLAVAVWQPLVTARIAHPD